MNMLSPKKTKFRKQFKGRIHGSAKVILLLIMVVMA
jgi:ribosomal protein L16/L10AE